jgi:putative FmdB family regulatory protein
MPIYEYRCRQCEAEFEKLVGSDTAVACPHCDSAQVTRRLSLFRARVQAGVGPPAAGGPGGCCGGGGCGCH